MVIVKFSFKLWDFVHMCTFVQPSSSFNVIGLPIIDLQT